MKKVLIILAFFPMSFLHSEEPTYQFTFGSNLKLFPIQFNRTNKDVKTPVSIKLNKWIVSPTTSSFTGNNLLTGLSKSKNNKDKIYFKLKIKF